MPFVTATRTSTSVGAELCRELTLATSDSLATRRNLGGPEADRAPLPGANFTPLALVVACISGGHEELRAKGLESSSSSKSMKVRLTVKPNALLFMPAALGSSLRGATTSAEPTATVAIVCLALLPADGATNTSCRSGCCNVNATRLPMPAPTFALSAVGATLSTFTGCILSTMRLSDPAFKSQAGTCPDSGNSPKARRGWVGWSEVRVRDEPSARVITTQAAWPTMVLLPITSTYFGTRLKLS
mmetsp:Transcript_27693/g.64024  ORF Transcript_27693/g.64024 Transcript_27693/m.64024 type:complete len:244 (-) Transcript_27693:95-826(-)